MERIQQLSLWDEGSEHLERQPPGAPDRIDPKKSSPPVTTAVSSDLSELHVPENPRDVEATCVEYSCGPPVAAPLVSAVEAGVFGFTVAGPIVPDDDDVAALTTEHAHEMIILLADQRAVADAIRAGVDPTTGRSPKTPESRERLAGQLTEEHGRLIRAYADAAAAYAEAFGDGAAAALDEWVRKTIADEGSQRDSYPPTHPWHYFHAGDNAAPVPVEAIPADDDAGQFLERDLPKNPAKRLAKLRELLTREREQLETDRKRYAEIAERGAEALSRYDREIAHTSDAMARASALALKYRHVCLGLGRVAWIENELRRHGVRELFTDEQPQNAGK